MIDVVVKIGLVYLGITAIGAIAFRIEGMSTFDAIGHCDGGGRHRRLLLARRQHRLVQEPGDRMDGVV